MKLRYKLNLFIIGLIVLSISIPFFVYYYVSREAIKEQVNGYLKLELAKNAYEINGWIETRSQSVIILSSLIQKYYVKEDITEELLKSYITDENVSDLYVGYEDGSFVSGIGWIPDSSYDPRIRPWYREMMDEGKFTVSNMYFDYTSDEYAVSIGMPLIDKNGKTIGVIAEDILLSSFYEKIQEIHLKHEGYAYLVDMNGKILVHRDKGLIGQNFNDLTEGEIKIDPSLTKEGSLTYTYKDEKKIVVYNSLPGTKWLLVLVAVEKEAYQPLYSLLLLFLIIAISTILLAFVLIGFFNRDIISRLKRLSEASISLSEGNFDVDVKDMGKDEIGDVSNAFTRMKNEIQDKMSELNTSRANYEELVENTADAICSVNRDGYLITANSVFLHLFSCESNVIGTVHFSEIVKGTMFGVILHSLLEEVLMSGNLIQRKLDDMDQRYYNVTLSPIMDVESKELKGVTTIIHDVSDLEISRIHLEWITHHDGLTDLPNRLKFMEDLNMVILKAKSKKNQFMVLLIDLDDFRNINDTMGYRVGDAILNNIADLLRRTYKSYRTGADEFAVVLEIESENEDLREQVLKIAKMIQGNYQIDFHTVYLTATMGAVCYPDDFSDVNEMMIRMDAALNYAKTYKKSDVQFYEYFISTELEKRVIIEKGLRHALENKEFVLFYQPIMIGNTKKIKGFEALIRWKKEDGCIITPGEFMPIAEHMLLMHEVGLWIIRQSLSDLKVVQEHYEESLSMAINISANQIKKKDFCENVIAIMEELQVDPNHVEFEITESVLIESLDLLRRQFQPLIDLGVRISLDDFGTGYSSLNYLQHFPFHILKIDKSFVDYIRQDITSKSLLNHIINIAHGMEMEIVAEGVENEMQSEYLVEKNCDYLQGYLFSKPLPVNEVLEFFQKEHIYK